MEENKLITDNFNKCINGFKNGSLNMIAGVTQMGLTSLLVNIACKCNAKKVLFFTLEELRNDIENRLETIGSNKNDIEIIDNVSSVESICEMVLNSNDVDMIVIDKLSLVKAENKDYTISKLKDLAVKKDIPIILTKTITRMINYRKDKRPNLDDTYKLNSYCDKVIYLYRDEYYNASYVTNSNEMGVTYIPKYSKTLESVDVELIVAKDNTDTSQKIINIHFDRAKGNYF